MNAASKAVEKTNDKAKIITCKLIERANALSKAILAEFTPPPMDEGAREALEAFVAKRKAEGGAPTDF